MTGSDVKLKIKLENLYLLRVDCDCFIVKGIEIDRLLTNISDYETVEFFDIADNYLRKPHTPSTKISYQELYHIKSIELKDSDN